MSNKEKKTSLSDWENTIYSAVSEGQVIIIPDQPLEEIFKSGFITHTPEVKKQMAYQLGLYAMGHLQLDAMDKAIEFCRKALEYDRNCQPAQACELAILRRNGNRSFTDDRADMEKNIHDPFVIGFSYYPSKLSAKSNKNELLEIAVNHIAGFFYWYARKKYLNKSSVLTNFGVTLIDCGAVFGGEYVLTTALEIDPNDLIACNTIASFYFRSQMYNEALNYHERIRKVDSKHVEEVERLKGILNALEHDIELVLSLPAHKQTEYSYDLAVFLMGKGLYNKAIEVLENSSIWRSKPEAAHLYGQCLMMLGKFEEALKKLQDAAKTFSPSQLLVSYCLLKLNKFPEVIKYINYNLETAPFESQPDFLFFIAESYRQFGDVEQEKIVVDKLFLWEMWVKEREKLGL